MMPGAAPQSMGWFKTGGFSLHLSTGYIIFLPHCGNVQSLEDSNLAEKSDITPMTLGPAAVSDHVALIEEV